MGAWYPWIVLVHLACAIVFVGAVTFEVLVVESLHKHFDAATLQRIEQAIMARVRRFMPVVVTLLFVSGGVLFDIRCDGISCVGSRFGNLLLLKVLLRGCWHWPLLLSKGLLPFYLCNQLLS